MSGSHTKDVKDVKSGDSKSSADTIKGNLVLMQQALVVMLGEFLKPPFTTSYPTLAKHVKEYIRLIALINLDNRTEFFNDVERIIKDDEAQWPTLVSKIYNAIHAVNINGSAIKLDLPAIDDKFDLFRVRAEVANKLFEEDLTQKAALQAPKVSPRSENGVYLQTLEMIQKYLKAWENSPDKISAQLSAENLNKVNKYVLEDEKAAKNNLNLIITEIAQLYEKNKADEKAVRSIKMLFTNIANRISKTELYSSIPPVIKDLASKSRNSSMMITGVLNLTPPSSSKTIEVSASSSRVSPRTATKEQAELQSLIVICNELKNCPIDEKNQLQVFLIQELTREVGKIQRDQKTIESNPDAATKNLIGLLKGIVDKKIKLDKANEPVIGDSNFVKAFIAVIKDAEAKNAKLKVIPVAEIAILEFKGVPFVYKPRDLEPPINQFKSLIDSMKQNMHDRSQPDFSFFPMTIANFRNKLIHQFDVHLNESKQSGVGLKHYHVVLNQMVESFLDFLRTYSTTNSGKLELIAKLIDNIPVIISKNPLNPELCCKEIIGELDETTKFIKQDTFYQKLSSISSTAKSEIAALQKQSGIAPPTATAAARPPVASTAAIEPPKSPSPK